jgi:hypothetical protein
MPSEPDWLASISSGTVCMWFYILAIINSIFAVAGVVILGIMVSRGAKSPLFFFLPLVSILVGLTNAWFMFVICNRGINREGFESKKK